MEKYVELENAASLKISVYHRGGKYTVRLVEVIREDSGNGYISERWYLFDASSMGFVAKEGRKSQKQLEALVAKVTSDEVTTILKNFYLAKEYDEAKSFMKSLLWG